MRKHLLCLLSVVLLLPLSGCVSQEPSELEGDWYFAEDLVLDFKRDGVIIGYVDDEEREGRSDGCVSRAARATFLPPVLQTNA